MVPVVCMVHMRVSDRVLRSRWGRRKINFEHSLFNVRLSFQLLRRGDLRSFGDLEVSKEKANKTKYTSDKQPLDLPRRDAVVRDYPTADTKAHNI